MPKAESPKEASFTGAPVLLAVLVVLHIGLAVWFASITPWRQSGVVFGQTAKDIGAPDERQHTNYVSRLVQGNGFPTFDPHDPNLYEDYQSHQPPLYYGLAATWCKAAGVSDLSQRDDGVRLRMLNAVIGAFGVVGAYFFALWSFKSPGVALAAAAFYALLPMNLALDGAVSNDPLLITLCAWVLAICAKGITSGWSWKLAVGAGVLTGLALLTKTTGVALFPALLVAALVPQMKRPSFAMAAGLVIIALAIVTPWWIRNQSLYGDPLAMKAFNAAFTGSAQKSTIVTQISLTGDSSPEMTYWKDWVGWWTARSFFGAFGYMDIWLNENGRAMSIQNRDAIYRVLMVVFGLASLGWLLASAKPDYRKAWPVQAVGGVFLLVVLGLFIRFNMQYFQAQGRYLMPALVVIAAGIGLGAVHLARGKALVAVAAVAIVLGGVDLYALNILPGEFVKRETVGSLTSVPPNAP